MGNFKGIFHSGSQRIFGTYSTLLFTDGSPHPFAGLCNFLTADKNAALFIIVITNKIVIAGLLGSKCVISTFIFLQVFLCPLTQNQSFRCSYSFFYILNFFCSCRHGPQTHQQNQSHDSRQKSLAFFHTYPPSRLCRIYAIFPLTRGMIYLAL